MKLLLKSDEETLGYAEAQEARTDPPMGCGEISFLPAAAYSRVESLFRNRTIYNGLVGNRDEAKLALVDRELSAMSLSLIAETGELLEVVGFTVSDYRPEFPEEGLILEFIGMHHKQFEKLFPGHYAKYEASHA